MKLEVRQIIGIDDKILKTTTDCEDEGGEGREEVKI